MSLSSDLAGLAALLLVLIVAFIEYRLAPAIRDPTPSNVQGGVKQMLLAIVLLDATMIYGASGNAVIAIATALLIVPAATLGRFIFITYAGKCPGVAFESVGRSEPRQNGCGWLRNA